MYYILLLKKAHAKESLICFVRVSVLGGSASLNESTFLRLSEREKDLRFFDRCLESYFYYSLVSYESIAG